MEATILDTHCIIFQRESGQWGGEMEICAMAEVLKCKITVWQPDDLGLPKPLTSYGEEGTELNLFYENRNHYEFFPTVYFSFSCIEGKFVYNNTQL